MSAEVKHTGADKS